jgi:hypothetical protein
LKREDREQVLGKTLAAWQVEMTTDDLEDMMARALEPEELLDLNDLAARSLLLPDGTWDFSGLIEEVLERFHRLVLQRSTRGERQSCNSKRSAATDEISCRPKRQN